MPSPGDLPDSGIEPGSPALQADSLLAELPVKNPPAKAGDAGDSGLIPGKIPWRREWQPTLVFLPRKSYGQRSLVGYSPQGHKVSDKTEHLTCQAIPFGTKYPPCSQEAGGFGQGASWYLSRAASFQLSYFVEEENGLRAQSIKALPCLTAQLGHIGDKKKCKPHSWLEVREASHGAKGLFILAWSPWVRILRRSLRAEA